MSGKWSGQHSLLQVPALHRGRARAPEESGSCRRASVRKRARGGAGTRGPTRPSSAGRSASAHGQCVCQHQGRKNPNIIITKGWSLAITQALHVKQLVLAARWEQLDCLELLFSLSLFDCFGVLRFGFGLRARNSRHGNSRERFRSGFRSARNRFAFLLPLSRKDWSARWLASTRLFAR